MRSIVGAILALVFVVSLARATSALDDISQAYAHVKPSLVKVWAFDATGIPTDSGTGFVVQSDARESWIVTATHVVDGASSVTIDISRELHDLPASIVAKTSKRDDITLLLVHRGNLPQVHFAARNQTMAEGKFVAAAGYFQNDDQIGASGQAPKLVGPGTVASLPENGNFLGINLNVEEGLSGAPVFDSNTGDVVGVVDVKSAVGSGGYAVSAPLIVLAFLSQNRVAVPGGTAPPAVAYVSPSPAPARVAVAPSPASAPIHVAVAQVVQTPPAQATLAPVPVRTPVFAAPQSLPTPLSAVPVGKADPNDVNACFGRVLVKADRAIAACTSLIALGTPNAFLYDRRSRAYFLKYKADLALADCSQALRIDPDDAAAHENCAAAYDEKYLWDLALAEADKAIKLNPNYAPAYVARGYAYEYQGLPQSRPLALNDYNTAVRLDPNLSFFIQAKSHMPFEHAAIPPVMLNPPAGFAPNGNGPVYALYYHPLSCSAEEFYNDFTAVVYFNLFIEQVRTPKDRDPTHWRKVGRYRLAPGQTTTVSFGACLTPSWFHWTRDVRFGTDEGPVLFPSQNI